MSTDAIDLTADAAGPSLVGSVLPLRARILARLRQVNMVDTLAIVLAAGALASGIATYASMTGLGSEGPNATATLILLNVDLLIVLGLTVLVATRLVRLWRAHRAGTMGSRLHVRLVVLFGVIAMTPTVLIAIFSTLFFTFGVQAWFGERVKTAVTESAAIARAYLAEHQQAIKADALAVANDINRQWVQLSSGDQRLRDSFLSTQAAFRGLTEAVIFANDLKVLAKAGYTFALQTGEQVPFAAIATANIGRVAVLTGQSSDRVRALVKLESYPAAYLLVGRFVDANVLARLSRTEEAVSEYLRLEGARSDLEVSFTLLFSVVALLLLLVSVWFGLALATRLARPIIELINASERVRGGDLTVRVRESDIGDELAYLGRSFNRMTKRLDEQQTALRDTNAQLDERRRFTETVLAGVSAGVIGLDPRGHITLPNRSASVLLSIDLTKAIGRPLAEVVPAFARMLAEVQNSQQKTIQEEVQIVEGSTQKTFLVRMSGEQVQADIYGYVVTFDDITALQSAQRKAAWADVARRIAHEIKNPLTPIQLSAERLRRKYLDKLGDDSGLLSQCTDTIIRHVGDIGHMVDEFSAFARLPSAVLKSTDLAAVVRDAVMLQRHAYPQITFEIETPAGQLLMRCDARQVGQALTNVLKNAVEAIDARFGAPAPGQAGQGRIAASIKQCETETVISVVDNGVGLPQAERERLTEPYVTTRAKGTGLGLAIVKKIIEDHGGRVTLEDLPGSDLGGSREGAQVTLHFPSTLATMTSAGPGSGVRGHAVRAGE
ncbi:MAG: PAS domain-containing sensor histidine kinase [Rhodospirillaceae bacterium]|nr:PAS domain-containing sensor histidine kinase [Rhodospirillaceae bacterium]